MALEFEEFKAKAAELCRIDLSFYKSAQMDRRIHSLMHAWGVKDYDEYYHVLQTNPPRFQEFVKKLTINVSEFFRNPERFVEVQERVLPELLARRPNLDVWSAGCSNGAEPYTLGIILRELGAGDKVRILASDIDHVILNKARAGVYSPGEVKNVSRGLLSKYFEFKDGYYYISQEIKKMVEFRQHNLLRDPYPRMMDFILCRNVVIYFTEEAKAKLYANFFTHLNPGGYLMVGGTEPLLNYKNIGFENPLSFFYRRPLTNGERGLVP